MPAKSIPDGYHTVTPYIIVKGVDRLIDFLKQAFDAQEKERLMRPDGTIMHAELQKRTDAFFAKQRASAARTKG